VLCGIYKRILAETGFKGIDLVRPITAIFQAVSIYHINAINLDNYTSNKLHSVGGGTTFALGNDIDKLCMVLFGSYGFSNKVGGCPDFAA
jgi:hypothetical protein